jgi:hypothetical protein
MQFFCCARDWLANVTAGDAASAKNTGKSRQESFIVVSFAWMFLRPEDVGAQASDPSKKTGGFVRSRLVATLGAHAALDYGFMA